MVEARGRLRVGPRLWSGLRGRLGVRLRSALAAAAVVAVALLVAGLVVVSITRAALTSNVDAAATQRAGEVAAALTAGRDAGLRSALRSPPGEQTIVQVVGPADTVTVASAGVDGEPPLSPLRPPVGQTLREQRTLPVADQDTFRIVAVGVETPQGARTVLVGQSLRPVADSVRVLSAILLGGLPLLVLVVGAATFVFVARSLRPVEAIRRRVAGITGRDMQARVPVPAAHDEIAALAETMNDMLDRLESTVTVQRRFLADASHELRSPLATVQVGLDILASSHDLPDVSQQHVERLRTETVRLGRLVGDLLLLARVDEHGLAPRRDDVDLDDLAYAERDRLAAEHPRLRLQLTIKPVRVQGDPHHLGRALRNLVDNAARYARTTVTIRVWADPTAAYVEVDDDGPGIPAADRGRIFDRFVRLDDSRSRTDGGTGLGLPIAREIIAVHGGAVTVIDSDSGAVLRIRLPNAPVGRRSA
ncbi:MAG: integral rane sensor signal transduction histidine kinase [Dactylosporangium sp.]|jgi:signal transduction histidine kinase|nr:integral rane sensor signal transduction histidine kinase [Dactylosporangium sp.]